MKIPFCSATRPQRTLALLTVGLFALLTPWAAVAQNEELPPGAAQGSETTLVITDNVRAKVRLAYPQSTYENLSDNDRHVAEEIEQTLRDDLDYSGIFNVQGPADLAVLQLTSDQLHNFEQYRSLQNDVVLLTTIKREADKLVLEWRLYDLPSKQSIDGKRYRGLPSQGRRIAHTLADELHRQFTGRPGIALTTIAFQSDRDGANRQELYLMDYDGRNQRRISAHQSTSGYSAWSPDGSMIAYMSYFSGEAGIYYVDLATSNKVPVFVEGTLNLSPTFSPDGRQIAFAHSDESTNIDIYICPRQCSSPTRITKASGIDTNPAWSPDARQIAFTSDRSGRPHVYIMNTDGTGIRRISFEGDYNEGAAWRPDGAYLVYASRRGNRFQIAMTSTVDLQTRTLTSGPDSYEEPTFSPDGKRILFTVRKGRESQVWVMNADGTNGRQLTHEGNNMGPAWSPFVQR